MQRAVLGGLQGVRRSRSTAPPGGIASSTDPLAVSTAGGGVAAKRAPTIAGAPRPAAGPETRRAPPRAMRTSGDAIGEASAARSNAMPGRNVRATIPPSGPAQAESGVDAAIQQLAGIERRARAAVMRGASRPTQPPKERRLPAAQHVGPPLRTAASPAR
jgi:hypothetical protein